MIVLLATVGLVSAGPRKVKEVTPSVPLTVPATVKPTFEWPEARATCPTQSANTGIIRSKQNEIVSMEPKTKIYVQHKVDVDRVEDRCINMVRIEHMPDRGCKYTMIFKAKRGYTDLQLSTLNVHADSWCPGWRDWRETGETKESKPYSRRLNDNNLALMLSKTHVPDPVSDRSCTDLAMNVDGKVALTKTLGGRGEPFRLENLSFVGQYDSVGEPSSICPDVKQIVVERVEAPTVPQDNPLKNTAVLAYIAHEPLPNFAATDGGISAFQHIGENLSLRADASIGPLNHNAFNVNYGFGSSSVTSGMQIYVGARLGGFEDLRGDDYSAFGVNLGFQSNRYDESSPTYFSVELTPVLYSESVPNYIQGSGTTDGGIMMKILFGTFLRKAE
ncbi:MAG: hypothetical protein CL930_01865 [Deltaproteobacteria bacterium]|nr:hypothetical protein [Deltaproteobacteria bacterium]